MDTIIINRQLADKEIIAIKAMMEKGDFRLYASLGLPAGLAHLIPEQPVLSSQEKKQLFANALSGLLQFGDKIIDGIAVSKRLTIGSMPLWHYQRFRIYFPLRTLLLELAELRQLSIDSDRLICYSSSTLLSGLPELPSNVELHVGIAQKSAVSYKMVAAFALFAILRFFIGAFQMMNISGKRHVILDRSEKQVCVDPDTLRTKQDNYNLSYLLDRSGEEFLVISEVEIPKFNTASSFRLRGYHFWQQGRMQRTLYGEYILFRAMLSQRIHRQKAALLRDFDCAVEKIGKASLSQSEKLIFSFFIGLRRTNSFFVVKYLAYLRFFKQHRFVTISCIDENSPSVRCILDAGRAHGSEIIGIQHGMISDEQPAYLYTASDRGHHVMADHTLVWGEYWKAVLINKCNYPPERIHVIGQLRTDVIPRLKETSDIDLKTKLTGGKSLVVFASQPQPDARVRRQAAFDVFTALKDEKDVFILVKLHPAERNAVGYYNGIAEAAGCSNYRLVYDIDLYRLLAACDVLITCYSAVGTEAVYFAKPLIILDYNRDDLMGYHAEGVAAQATCTGDLKMQVRGFLDRKMLPDKAAYAAFINAYAYQVDGHAVDRCLEFIRSLEQG